MNGGSVPASTTAATPKALRAPAAGTALRNLLWLSGDKVVSVALGLLVFGLIARHYGPGGAGQFSYAVAMLQTALGLSLVCSAAAVMPRLCRLHNGAAAMAVVNVFAVRLIGSMLAAAVMATYTALAVDDPLRRTVALILLSTVPLLEPFRAFANFWVSRNQNRTPVLARGSGLVARLVVVVVALWAGAPPWVVALAWLVEALVSAALQTLGMRGVLPWRRLAGALHAPRARLYFRFGVRFAAGLWLSHLFLRLDRLWLAERMDAHAFGLYATAMQLVAVWLQAAAVLTGSLAPAYLYRALRQSSAVQQHWGTLAMLAGVGLAGLAGAVLLGPLLLRVVFGAQFAPSQPYLVAGFAAAVLFFVDQFVQIAITANNRPWLLALKWGTASTVALATLVIATPHIGAYSGPLGLALGLVVSWIAVVAGARWAGAAATDTALLID
jgi:PST family polysaccharide transporter